MGNIVSENFVHIQALFDEKKDRTIETLKECYNDKALLRSVIEGLSDKILVEQNVKGKKILLKPNWVKHPYQPHDDICLTTHPNFTLAVLEVVLAQKPASVVIGDAPIQGCRWDKMLGNDFAAEVKQLSQKHNVPVSIKDFRRVIFDPITNKAEPEKNPLSSYLIFDTGKKSFLEPITPEKKNLFRVAQYNPDKFIETHRRGMHKYCITRELFNADIVISLPKIKTHQKAGITGSLKNIVGLNGDKDFLPHHRIGGTEMGGDSYPGKNILRHWSELATDNASRKKGKASYWFWLRLSSLLWKISLPGKEHQPNAAWYGNDTTWRMVMDLNTIVLFGKADGTLAETPQRVLYSFCDGIIGGQGNGPLRPDPLNLGVVCFSDNSAATDICMALMMGLDTEKIPLLAAAKSFMPGSTLPVTITLNGQRIQQQELKKYAVAAAPPSGWINYRQAQ
jgi:uncharacterized protein (DUF362 family)